MTIDEAIKHCEEVAKKYKSRLDSPYKTEEHELDDKFCKECAADHWQLALWLMQLKEARQYLMEAVDGFRAFGKELDEKCELNLDCSKCQLNNGGNCRSWKHTKAVMKLIGGK